MVVEKKLALEELKTYKKLTSEEQKYFKDEIIEAFRVFWSFNPTEEEFAEALGGLVLFSEILYIMQTKPETNITIEELNIDLEKDLIEFLKKEDEQKDLKLLKNIGLEFPPEKSYSNKQVYKYSGDLDYNSELAVYTWNDGTCSLRTFKHNDSEDYIYLSNTDRERLIKQLQNRN